MSSVGELRPLGVRNEEAIFSDVFPQLSSLNDNITQMAFPVPEMTTFLGKVFMALASDCGGFQLEKLKDEIKKEQRINPEETAQAFGFESFSAFLDSAEASSCVTKESITNQNGVQLCIYKAKQTGIYRSVFQLRETVEDQARERKQRQERNFTRNYQAEPASTGRSTSDNYQQRSYNNIGSGCHQPPRQPNPLTNKRSRVQSTQEMAIPGKYYRGQGEPEGIEDYADEEFEEDCHVLVADNNQQQKSTVAGISTSAMVGEDCRNESVKQEQMKVPNKSSRIHTNHGGYSYSQLQNFLDNLAKENAKNM